MGDAHTLPNNDPVLSRLFFSFAIQGSYPNFFYFLSRFRLLTPIFFYFLSRFGETYGYATEQANKGNATTPHAFDLSLFYP